VWGLWCSAELVDGGAVEDLEDVVAAFVPFELFGGLLDLGGEDDGEGQRAGGEEIIVAGRGLEILHGLGELVSGEELVGLLGWDGCGLREEETGHGGGCCGERSGADEAAARWILDHEEVKHIGVEFPRGVALASLDYTNARMSEWRGDYTGGSESRG
jgi:hypothetical protein